MMENRYYQLYHHLYIRCSFPFLKFHIPFESYHFPWLKRIGNISRVIYNPWSNAYTNKTGNSSHGICFQEEQATFDVFAVRTRPGIRFGAL
jgi:hypothetical protein